MIAGRYRDIVARHGRPPRTGPWRSNLVVAGCYELLASLVKGRAEDRGSLWFAVGDGHRPPHPGQTGLVRETRRQPVSPDHMAFVDQTGQASPVRTRHVEIRTAFRAAWLRRAREFGVFGGAATSEPGSGLLINRAVHPPLALRDDDIVERRLILSFGAVVRDDGGTPGGVVLGADWPVRAIKGVDEVFAGALEAFGIATIGGLAAAALHPHPSRIAADRYREFVHKARMVTSFAPHGALEVMPSMTVAALLELSPAQLVEASGGALDEGTAAELQSGLGPLQVALDVSTLAALELETLHR